MSNQAIQDYIDNGGNITRAAKKNGLHRSTLRKRLIEAGIYNKPIVKGTVHERHVPSKKLPSKNKIKRYIFTSAQNNTRVNQKCWETLLTISKQYDAEIHISTYTYNKNAYGSLSVKRGTEDTTQELWYDRTISEFLSDSRIEIAPGLIWCGELNILPTAVNPLSGLETYSGSDCGIIPHAKIACESIANNSVTKFNYTTGTVTQRNYIQKKAGLKAEHHHCYGALLVEVNHKGEWWARQLESDKNGCIYDLDKRFKGKNVSNSRVEAVTWGDVHALGLDDQVKECNWGLDGILDTLNPKYQFIHDLLLGETINHHEAGNSYEAFRKAQLNDCHVSVSSELRHATLLLDAIEKKGCTTVVVDSNHDSPWLFKWLQNPRVQHDTTNVLFWHNLNWHVLSKIKEDPEQSFNILEQALILLGVSPKVKFLKTDESFLITPSEIDCGMHGHLGTNGSRATPKQLSKLGKKANIGHTHSAGIYDGLYVCGTSTKLNLGYNKGPSSWSHTHTVTYPNGKRTLLTICNGKWRA